MDRTDLLLAVALLVAAAPGAGCASKCATTCPPTERQTWSGTGDTVKVTGLAWTGPACPNTNPKCRGPGSDGCQRFGIVAGAPGTCDLTITASDRAPITIHGE